MYTLKFDEDLCSTCPTCDCLVKCQYMGLEVDEAKDEMMKIIRGDDSPVLQDCVTCYGCEEYCRRGNHPFYLITERREEKGVGRTEILFGLIMAVAALSGMWAAVSLLISWSLAS